MSEKLLAIIGLGYVGLPLAVAFGRQRPVVGFDIHGGRISALKDGYDATRETDKDELLALIICHLPISWPILPLRRYISTVPTPVDAAKQPDMSALEAASRTVGSVLKAGDIVIFESTVYPGATEVCVPQPGRPRPDP